jgi:hypothetical protein
MSKTHKFKQGEDFRGCGQTDFEYANTTECGYVRNFVTNNDARVTCQLCLREMHTGLTTMTKDQTIARLTLGLKNITKYAVPPQAKEMARHALDLDKPLREMAPMTHEAQ